MYPKKNQLERYDNHGHVTTILDASYNLIGNAKRIVWHLEGGGGEYVLFQILVLFQIKLDRKGRFSRYATMANLAI